MVSKLKEKSSRWRDFVKKHPKKITATLVAIPTIAGSLYLAEASLKEDESVSGVYESLVNTVISQTEEERVGVEEILKEPVTTLVVFDMQTGKQKWLHIPSRFHEKNPIKEGIASMNDSIVADTNGNIYGYLYDFTKWNQSNLSDVWAWIVSRNGKYNSSNYAMEYVFYDQNQKPVQGYVVIGMYNGNNGEIITFEPSVMNSIRQKIYRHSEDVLPNIQESSSGLIDSISDKTSSIIQK